MQLFQLFLSCVQFFNRVSFPNENVGSTFTCVLATVVCFSKDLVGLQLVT